MHNSYRTSLPLHSVGVEDDRSSLENNRPARGSYDILTIEGKIDLQMELLFGFQIEFLQTICALYGISDLNC
jgi:hypothetical protein